MAVEHPHGPSTGIGRPRQSAALLAIGFAVAAVVLVLVVCSGQGWRDRYVQPTLAQEPVATLAIGTPAQACADVGPLPDGAARAAFTVAAGGSGATVRTLTSGLGVPAVRGAPAVVGASTVIRPGLGAVDPDGRPRRVCLEHVAGPPVAVLGQGDVPALRLTGAEPETVWSVLGAIVDRSTRATSAPARWVGLPGALVLLALASGAALVLVVLAWSPGRLPSRGTWAVVVGVALAHGAAWSIVTPPFEVPDEWSHFHYADYVADHGTLPNGLAAGVPVAPDQEMAMILVGANGLPGHPSLRPPWSAADDSRIRAGLAAIPDASVPDGRTSATGQPPGYYLLAGAVAKVAAGNVLDRVWQVRLVGILALGALAAGAMALARRLAPRRPEWAVTVGLLTGLAPLLGFLAGGVTPDVPLVTAAVWTMWAALTFVDQPDRWTGLRLGMLLVALILVKLTALALVPGIAVLVLLALAIAVRRGWPPGSTGAVAGLAAGLAVPLLAYIAWCVASDRSIVPGVLTAVVRSEVDATVAPGSGPVSFLSSAWQLYLPRLPGIDDLAPGVGPRTFWLNGFVGRYGWLDVGLPTWVEKVLPPLWIGIAFLGVRGVRGVLPARDAGRAAWVRQVAIAAAFLLLLAGLLLTIARADYSALVSGGDRFTQPRYLLPALPVAVVVVLLALRGTPDRVRPWFAVGLVGVAVLHVLASILATAGRFYV
ncbi:DUF2142 domain-containing protein [Patulibacter sp.]|uniref:DUF2142 domain-containing protein n=1 Tax=Patulibacter sp. TaxID=1912859 RepID=UPI0027198A7F|nr:DUF2142 domain-containing protein [Patulibacter sp.]MDO9408779.1 DUF2142 domain-containing protein [Patulibacter sp.]